MSSWYDDDEPETGMERAPSPSASHSVKEDELHTASKSAQNEQQALPEQGNASPGGRAHAAHGGFTTRGADDERQAHERFSGEYGRTHEGRDRERDRGRDVYANDAGFRRGYDDGYGRRPVNYYTDRQGDTSGRGQDYGSRYTYDRRAADSDDWRRRDAPRLASHSDELAMPHRGEEGAGGDGGGDGRDRDRDRDQSRQQRRSERSRLRAARWRELQHQQQRARAGDARGGYTRQGDSAGLRRESDQGQWQRSSGSGSGGMLSRTSGRDDRGGGVGRRVRTDADRYDRRWGGRGRDGGGERGQDGDKKKAKVVRGRRVPAVKGRVVGEVILLRVPPGGDTNRPARQWQRLDPVVATEPSEGMNKDSGERRGWEASKTEGGGSGGGDDDGFEWPDLQSASSRRDPEDDRLATAVAAAQAEAQASARHNVDASTEAAAAAGPLQAPRLKTAKGERPLPQAAAWASMWPSLEKPTKNADGIGAQIAAESKKSKKAKGKVEQQPPRGYSKQLQVFDMMFRKVDKSRNAKRSQADTKGTSAASATRKKPVVIRGKQRLGGKKKKPSTLKKMIMKDRLAAWTQLPLEERRARWHALHPGAQKELTQPTRVFAISNMVRTEDLLDDTDYLQMRTKVRTWLAKLCAKGALRRLGIPRPAGYGETLPLGDEDEDEADDGCEDGHKGDKAEGKNESEETSKTTCEDKGQDSGSSPVKSVEMDEHEELHDSDSAAPTSTRGPWCQVQPTQESEVSTAVAAAWPSLGEAVQLRTSKPGREAEQKAHPELDTEPEATPELQPELLPEFEPEPKPEPELEVQPEQEAKLEPELKLEPGSGEETTRELEQQLESRAAGNPRVLVLRNLVCEDDLQDDDEYEEIVSDVGDMCRKHGAVDEVVIPRSNGAEHIGCAFVVFQDAADTLAAQVALNASLVGGRTLQAQVTPAVGIVPALPAEQLTKETTKPRTTAPVGHEIQLYNLVTPEELEDDDEYEEIIGDVHAMCSECGVVRAVRIPRGADDEHHGVVLVHFDSEAAATAAQAMFDGKVVGGRTLRVVNVMAVARAVAKEHLVQFVNLVNADELEDDDEYEEIVADVEEMCSACGAVESVAVPRGGEEHVGCVFVQFVDATGARMAQQQWNGKVIGGREIRVEWFTRDADPVGATVLLRNFVTADELVDDDEYEEIVADVEEMCSACGEVQSVAVPRGEEEHVGSIFVKFADSQAARAAQAMFDGKVVSGRTLAADLLASNVDIEVPHVENGSGASAMSASTQPEMPQDGTTHGDARSDQSQSGTAGLVFVQMSDVRASKMLQRRVHERVFDGRSLCAVWCTEQLCEVMQVFDKRGVQPSLPEAPIESSGSNDKKSGDDHGVATDEVNNDSAIAVRQELQAMTNPEVIDDTLLGLKGAEVPKPVPSDVPRSYVNQKPDDQVDALVKEMLGLLMKYQERARIKDAVKAKARRRLVFGLREVRRGVRSGQIKCVILAPNLEVGGAVDSKVQEIIDEGKVKGVMLVFALNRRKLGKALGKTVKVSIVGVQNMDGANQEYKHLRQRMEVLSTTAADEAASTEATQEENEAAGGAM